MAGCVGLFAALRQKNPKLITGRHELYIDAAGLKTARVVPIVAKVSACMGNDNAKAFACTDTLAPDEQSLWDLYFSSYEIAMRAESDPKSMSDAERTIYQGSYQAACALAPVSEPLDAK